MGCMMVIGQRIGTRTVSNEDLFPLKPVIKAMISPNPNRKSRRLSQSIIGLNSTRDIKDFYDIENGRLLGSGASGPVRVCVHKGTQLEFALKRLSKLKLAPDKLDQLRIEIAIMADLDHPNILRLLEYFETDDEIYLILEICRGGELLDHLHDSPDHKYTEAVACKLIYTMLSAVRYCHAHNIVHRDLKLENFLFENENHDSQLKLIDFGLSQRFKSDEVLHRAVGTPYYVSPEVLAGNYNYKCDIWSIGVIAYMLLSGVPPFHGADDKATLQSVREGKWKFFDSLFKFISPAAKDFISTCLERQMNVRPSAMMAMKHEWFDMLKIPDAPVDISDNIVERIRGFERRSTLSKLCMEILSHNLALGQIEHLHQEFMKIDRHKIGEISYGELRNVLNCQVISGELTDEEVKNLFVGVNFDQTGMIQYHEFLAATISRKAITEENMRIAFERMSNSSSFVTGTDLCDLLGLDVTSDQVAAIVHEIQMMPGERIDFKQFKRIMLSGTSSSLVRRREGFYPNDSCSSLDASSIRTAAITQASRRVSRQNSLENAICTPTFKTEHSTSSTILFSKVDFDVSSVNQGTEYQTDYLDLPRHSTLLSLPPSPSMTSLRSLDPENTPTLPLSD